MAIARTFLKNAPILILVEATSHLDTLMERRVRAALDGLMSERTTIAIAHRLSTIRRADLILVMRGGRIVERGNHGELMTRDGYYAQPIARQTLKKEGEGGQSRLLASAE